MLCNGSDPGNVQESKNKGVHVKPCYMLLSPSSMRFGLIYWNLDLFQNFG